MGNLQQTVSELQNIRDTIAKKIEITLQSQIKRDEMYKNDLIRKLASFEGANSVLVEKMDFMDNRLIEQSDVVNRLVEMTEQRSSGSFSEYTGSAVSNLSSQHSPPYSSKFFQPNISHHRLSHTPNYSRENFLQNLQNDEAITVELEPSWQDFP